MALAKPVHRFRRGFHGDAVQPEENAAIELARVHLVLEGPEGALRQDGADTRGATAPWRRADIRRSA